MKTPEVLSPEFFDRNTLDVARDLLGRDLLRQVDGRWLRARIVETEAYLGAEDPASHGHRGPTPRAKVMYGPPGCIYVYFIYGNYHMLNFVTESEGTPGAVLIRAVEPLEGQSLMEKLRALPAKMPEKKRARELTSGPAKLVLALGIDGGLNGLPLGLPHLAVLPGIPVPEKKVVRACRVGISSAKDLPYRFYVKGNAFVSRH